MCQIMAKSFLFLSASKSNSSFVVPRMRPWGVQNKNCHRSVSNCFSDQFYRILWWGALFVMSVCQRQPREPCLGLWLSTSPGYQRRSFMRLWGRKAQSNRQMKRARVQTVQSILRHSLPSTRRKPSQICENNSVLNKSTDPGITLTLGWLKTYYLLVESHLYGSELLTMK
jgi:hypothetical protein